MKLLVYAGLILQERRGCKLIFSCSLSLHSTWIMGSTKVINHIPFNDEQFKLFNSVTVE